LRLLKKGKNYNIFFFRIYLEYVSLSSVYDKEDYLNYALQLLQLDPAVDEPPNLTHQCAQLISQIYPSHTAEYKNILCQYTNILLDRIDLKINDRLSWELLAHIITNDM
jgi:hypothetical protein